jgi:hypothetical protein
VIWLAIAAAVLLAMTGLLFARLQAQHHRAIAGQDTIYRAAEQSTLKQLEAAWADRDHWVDVGHQREARIAALEADLALWRAKAEHWQQQYETANTDAIRARETVADWIAQRTFGKSIFGQAPALPERPAHPEPLRKGRVQARTLVQQADRLFEREYQNYMRSQAAQASQETE